MVPLPVIERELRVQSRKRATYFSRLGWGLAAVLLLGLLLWNNPQKSADGRYVLSLIHAWLAAMLFILGPVLSADSISREKREGTLGLLLLTPLTPRQIVLGKLLTHLLRLFYLALMMLPFLVLPVLLGGVTFQDFLLSAITLLLILAAGLSASLITSALLLRFTSVLLGAIALSTLLIFISGSCAANILFLLFRRNTFLDLPLFHRLVSAGPAFMICPVEMKDALAMIVTSPWSLSFLEGEFLICAALLLAYAVRFSARNVARQAESAVETVRQAAFRRRFLTPILWKATFRRSMSLKLDQNPFIWLEYRAAWSRAARSASILLLIAAETMLVISLPNRSDFFHAHFLILGVLLCLVTIKSSSSFQREKESGAFELLVVTPLTEGKLVSGRLRAVFSYYALVTLTLFGFALLGLTWSQFGLFDGQDEYDFYLTRPNPATSPAPRAFRPAVLPSANPRYKLSRTTDALLTESKSSRQSLAHDRILCSIPTFDVPAHGGERKIDSPTKPDPLSNDRSTVPAKIGTVFVRFALLFILGSLHADDWPQWRGPNRDGVWRETGIVEKIPATGLPVRWRAKVGNGYSGPVVAQGRVFAVDHAFDPEVERVLCFRETTGEPLWVHSYPCDYKDMEYGNGPRASPTVHAGKVYTLGTQGHLFCLDATIGEVVWKKNLVADFHGRVPHYGASAAPLVVGDLLIVSAGGQPNASIVALDRLTGDLRWSALSDRPAYSAPIAIEAGGTQQLIVWTADAINSLDPATGKAFWQIPWKAVFDPAQMVASPVFHKDMLLFLGAWSRGSKMLRLDPAKPAASVLWETGAKPTTTISTPLFQEDDYFYAILGNGSLACLEAATGKEVWTTREPTSGSYGNAHFTPNGDRVFLFNHMGHLILARLTPKGYEELGRCLLVEPTAGFRAQGPITWAHPAYANKHVFARNDRELVCASLAKDQAAEKREPTQAVQPRLLTDFDKNPALGLGFSPDGKLLALGTWQGLVKILDLSTGAERPAPKPHNDWLCSVAFSPDGKLLVSAGGSEFKPKRNGGKPTGQIKLWDVVAEKELGELTGHSNKVFSAAFSPAGKTVATASADQTVRLWDIETRKERHILQGHSDAVWSVSFSTDGKIVASASADRTVKLWDTASGKERLTFKGHEDEVRAVALSPDGKILASGSADWTVRLWDLATQKERAVLKGHQGGIQSLAFTSDSRTLATGSLDETVKLWNVSTGEERATLRGHRSGISAIAFSPDNQTLASGGIDDAVRLWPLAQTN